MLMDYACNPRSKAGAVGLPQVQGHSGLHSEFSASQPAKATKLDSAAPVLVRACVCLSKL